MDQGAAEKGYKKEQIKEGLRKAGYPQNTIDSIYSFTQKIFIK